jgi:Ca-activated chloride channel family protein
MQYFRFADPWLLALLLLMPYFLLRDKTARLARLRYSSIATLKSIHAPRTGMLLSVVPILRCLAVAFVVMALARPQEGRYSREILSEGVDIILAIDTSGSMEALDFVKEKKRITRLEVVKDVVAEFIRNRENDRIGIVAFGQEAFTQCPLTLDHDIVLTFLDKMFIGMAGDSTAIGSAIGIAAKRLKDLKAKSKIVILLTDGRNNTGALAPIQAAEIAKTLGVKVYTVGVGTRGKAPFLVDTVLGKRVVYEDVDIDEDTLSTISAMTSARYFRATDLESLQDIYQQIDSLEKTEVRMIEHTDYKELFHWFLLPGLGLILIEILASQTRLQRIP